MSKKLVFINKGELEMDFVKLMGVSVKESDSAIGFFGTGLKYAIATILRLGGQITIYSGMITYKFSTSNINLRGKDFNIVKMNDETLPFTTELGKTWEAWMAVRELYSNVLDENGIMRLEENLSPLPTYTQIEVEGEFFLDVYYQRDKYFLNKEEKPYFENQYLKAYTSNSYKAIFYKDIKISEARAQTLYKYNLKENVYLTEDRTLKYQSQLNEILEKAIITSDDEIFIRTLLTPESDNYENTLEFTESYGYVEPSQTFINTVKTLVIQKPKDLNYKAIRWLNRRLGQSGQAEIVEPNEIEKKQIAKSINYLKAIGYQDITTYPIKLSPNLGHGIMGRALNGSIWISKEAFKNGTKYLCSTIYEEYVHLKYSYFDHSRELQTYLFDKVISMAEEFVIKEPL